MAAAASTIRMAAAEPYCTSRKIRRRLLRRAAETPYDRPAAAIRTQSAAAVAERNGWASKALRIIARSAARFFPSMFQTPVTPPPEAAGMAVPCTDENNHLCKGFSEVACTNPSPKVWKPCSSDAVNLLNNSSADGAQHILNSDANGISELEILLKQKTFTRSEFDRSTAPKFVTHFSGISEAHQNCYMLPILIGRRRRTAMHRMARSPYFRAPSATNIKVHDLGSPGPIRRLRQKSNLISPSKDIQCPHGNRLPDPSTTLTPKGKAVILPETANLEKTTAQSSQTKLNTEAADEPPTKGDAVPSIIPYGRQISQILTAPKYVTHFSGISKAHQNGHMLPIPIGRMAMHRMSRSPYFRAASATNIKVHNLGSPGPIRRLRQKSNLISLSKDIQWLHGNRLLDPSTTLTSNGNESSKISVEKPLVPQDYTSDLHDRGNEDNKVANRKEKTCQSTTTFRDDLPSKLTTSMLQGRALKSMEDIDWPKFLNLKGKDKLDAPTDSHVQKPGSSISLKQGKIANTVESGPISGVEVIETVGAVSGSVAVSSGKRAPFRMSAPEDDFDLGDDDSSQTKLNTKAVMKASDKPATKGDVEFSFPIAPACSSFSLPSPLLERSSLQEEQISAPSQTKLNTEAVMKASDKPATKGDFEFSFPVAPACSSFSLPPTMPFEFKFNASNSTTTALPDSSYPVNGRKSLEAGDLFETSIIATSSCLPTSGPAVIATLSPSSDSLSTSAPSAAPLSNVSATSTSMSNEEIVASTAPWFELGSQASTSTRSHAPMQSAIPAKLSDNSGFKFNASNSTTMALPDFSYPVNGRKSLEAGDCEFYFPVAPACSSFSLPPPTPTMPSLCLPSSGPAVIGLEASTTLNPSSDSLSTSPSPSSDSISTSAPSAAPFSNVAATPEEASSVSTNSAISPLTSAGVGSSPFSLTAESQFGSSTSVTGSFFEASGSQMSSNDFGAKPFGSTVLPFTSSYSSSPLTTAASLFTFNSQKSAPSICSFITSSPFTVSSSASTGFTGLGFGSSFFSTAGFQILAPSHFEHMDVDEGSMDDDSIQAATSIIPQARFSFGSSSQPATSAEQMEIMEIDSCTIQSEPKYDSMADVSIQASPSTILPARFSFESTSQPSTSADRMEIDGPTIQELMALQGEDPRYRQFCDFLKLRPIYYAN